MRHTTEQGDMMEDSALMKSHKYGESSYKTSSNEGLTRVIEDNTLTRFVIGQQTEGKKGGAHLDWLPGIGRWKQKEEETTGEEVTMIFQNEKVESIDITRNSVTATANPGKAFQSTYSNVEFGFLKISIWLFDFSF